MTRLASSTSERFLQVTDFIYISVFCTASSDLETGCDNCCISTAFPYSGSDSNAEPQIRCTSNFFEFSTNRFPSSSCPPRAKVFCFLLFSVDDKIRNLSCSLSRKFLLTNFTYTLFTTDKNLFVGGCMRNCYFLKICF